MGLAFRPGDWVSDNADRIARVKDVHESSDGAVFLDLVMYNRKGDKLGRVSPAMGGPRSFEPWCELGSWRRVHAPKFPISLSRVGYTIRPYAGDALPPADWTPPRKRDREIRRRRPAIPSPNEVEG